MINTLPPWSYPLILFVLLLFAGAGEYIHLVPSGTFASLLLIVVGLVAPSPVFPHTQVQTPAATINTNTTEVKEAK